MSPKPKGPGSRSVKGKGRDRAGSRVRSRTAPTVRVDLRTKTIEDLPLIVMYLFGAVILLQLGWLFAVTYLVYSVFSLVWFMRFICVHCRNPRMDRCASGLGVVAQRLFGRGSPKVFRKMFNRNIPILFPAWFVPPLVSVYLMLRAYSPFVLVLTVIFVIDAFIVLPLTSNKHACDYCAMRTQCPWARKG